MTKAFYWRLLGLALMVTPAACDASVLGAAKFEPDTILDVKGVVSPRVISASDAAQNIRPEFSPFFIDHGIPQPGDSPKPSVKPTAAPTPPPSVKPSPTATPTAGPTATATATATSTPAAGATATPTPTPTPTKTP